MLVQFGENKLLHDMLHQRKLLDIESQDYAFVYHERFAIMKIAQEDDDTLWKWAKETLENALRRDSWFEYDNWLFWSSILDGVCAVKHEPFENFEK